MANLGAPIGLLLQAMGPELIALTADLHQNREYNELFDIRLDRFINAFNQAQHPRKLYLDRSARGFTL